MEKQQGYYSWFLNEWDKEMAVFRNLREECQRERDRRPYEIRRDSHAMWIVPRRRANDKD